MTLYAAEFSTVSFVRDAGFAEPWYLVEGEVTTAMNIDGVAVDENHLYILADWTDDTSLKRLDDLSNPNPVRFGSFKRDFDLASGETNVFDGKMFIYSGMLYLCTTHILMYDGTEFEDGGVIEVSLDTGEIERIYDFAPHIIGASSAHYDLRRSTWSFSQVKSASMHDNYIYLLFKPSSSPVNWRVDRFNVDSFTMEQGLFEFSPGFGDSFSGGIGSDSTDDGIWMCWEHMETHIRHYDLDGNVLLSRDFDNDDFDTPDTWAHRLADIHIMDDEVWFFNTSSVEAANFSMAVFGYTLKFPVDGIPTNSNITLEEGGDATPHSWVYEEIYEPEFSSRGNWGGSGGFLVEVVLMQHLVSWDMLTGEPINSKRFDYWEDWQRLSLGVEGLYIYMESEIESGDNAEFQVAPPTGWSEGGSIRDIVAMVDPETLEPHEDVYGWYWGEETHELRGGDDSGHSFYIRARRPGIEDAD